MDGDLVLLRDQDRSLWDADRIDAAKAEVDRAVALGGHGPYVLQAAIAALHTEDPQDWPQIAALYGELGRLTGSPVVELNRAAAIAEGGDLEAALRMVDGLDLDGYHYLHSTRAELLRRLDRSRRRVSSTAVPSSWSTPTSSGAFSTDASRSWAAEPAQAGSGTAASGVATRKLKLSSR